jgi:hypothetical protein
MTSVVTVQPISSADLQHTLVVAHPEGELTPDCNTVYCASFQLTWNVLADEVIQTPLHLDGNPALAEVLNKRLFDTKQISPDCYLALAGFARDGIVDRIKHDLFEKFHREPGVELTVFTPDDILAYAYLEKVLPFDTEFDVFDRPLVFSDQVAVQSFGIYKGDAAADQVVILDYHDPDDFILQLRALPNIDDEIELGWIPDRPRITDEIILAKVTPQATLGETVEAVSLRIRDAARARQTGRYNEDEQHRLAPRLNSNLAETVQIPKINLNIVHEYSEITGRSLLSSGFEGYFIARAMQATRFKLDEKGADLSSEGFMNVSWSISEEEPRRFVFDRPFLLFLREKKASQPYLAIWIGNSELLVKF